MEIKRLIYPELLDEMKLPGVSILLGARQVGKTFLLKKIFQQAFESGLKTAYFNLELPEDLRMFNRSDAEIYNFIAQAGDAIFIDEFHYLKNASRIFKMLVDSEKKVKIYASGSSSLEIHKHLKESLAGRRWITKLYPLSFNEFVQKFSPEYDRKKAFDEYVTYGGLPGLLSMETSDGAIRMLSEILEAYIQKDIKSLIKEENIRAFNSLLYLLAESQGSLISENALSREVGLTAATINKHISIMQSTYVCYPVYSYAKRLGNELKKSKKIYFYDMGIRNMLLKDFSCYQSREDIGVIAETFVFLQLLTIVKPNIEIRFWRNKAGKEIDFVILKNRKPFLLEVKTSLSSPEIPAAFHVFLESYPETTGGMIVSEDYKDSTHLKGKEIIFADFNSFLSILNDRLQI